VRAACYAQGHAEPKASSPIRVTPAHASSHGRRRGPSLRALPSRAPNKIDSASGSGSEKPIKKRDHNSINCRDPAQLVGLRMGHPAHCCALLSATPAAASRHRGWDSDAAPIAPRCPIWGA
jgi:hypothetical protein